MIERYGPPVFQILRGLPGSYNVVLMKASPKAEMSKDYLFHLLQEPRLHHHVVANSEHTAGQSGVNLTLLEAIKIPLPPLAEQRRIAEVLDRAEALRAKRRAALAQLDSLTQSLFLDPATNPNPVVYQAR
jgi:type I restriction enzyme S subunit